MRYSAILFDLDGTLCDTITLYCHAVLRSLKDVAGIDANEKEFFEWYTLPLHLKQILARHGLDESQVPAIRAHRDALYEQLLSEATEWLPGAEDLLRFVAKSGMQTAVITGSWMSYVDAIHRKLGVRRHFQHFITADEIHAHMKPDPYGLLLACERLGVEPKDCLYIGDQQFDIDASRAAGMPCWLVRGRWTPKHVNGAEREFGSPGDIVGVLKNSTD